MMTGGALACHDVPVSVMILDPVSKSLYCVLAVLDDVGLLLLLLYED